MPRRRTAYILDINTIDSDPLADIEKRPMTSNSGSTVTGPPNAAKTFRPGNAWCGIHRRRRERTFKLDAIVNYFRTFLETLEKSEPLRLSVISQALGKSTQGGDIF
jgi:hypothetical protein